MTEIEANQMEEKAKKEPYFSRFVWYNSYFEIVYLIPESRILYMKTPQWTHITSLQAIEDGYVVTVAIMASAFERDKDSIFKYPLIEWKKDS